MTRIVLLTKADCELCEQAKETLSRLAGELALTVEVLDVTSPRGQQLAQQGGIAFPPGVLVDGEPFSYGRLSERKLRRALAKRLASNQQRP
jgi:glutaredoxin